MDPGRATLVIYGRALFRFHRNLLTIDLPVGLKGKIPKMKSLLLAAALSIAGLSTASASTFTLTDSAVFSANSNGENYNGWIWNTRGAPDDRWNMYYSNSTDPNNPIFINSGNDSSAELNIALSPGIHRFVIFGEQTGADPSLVPDLQFAVNMSFNGDPGPHISGLTCATGVCANSHPNGLDYLGQAGQPGAGTLTYARSGHTVSLTEFTWVADDQVNLVWPYFAGLYLGTIESPKPDWVGSITLEVEGATVIPLPAAGWLLFAGLATLGLMRRRPVI